MLRTRTKTREEKLRRRKWQKAKGHVVTRKMEREALTAAEYQYREAVRVLVWKRSRGNCGLCGCSTMMGEMHESPSRAQTRGLPPEQRFSLAICERVHPACHAHVTENRWRVEFDDDVLRFIGRYTVREKGKAIFRQEARHG